MTSFWPAKIHQGLRIPLAAANCSTVRPKRFEMENIVSPKATG